MKLHDLLIKVAVKKTHKLNSVLYVFLGVPINKGVTVNKQFGMIVDTPSGPISYQ